jgi:hypothetical protein
MPLLYAHLPAHRNPGNAQKAAPSEDGAAENCRKPKRFSDKGLAVCCAQNLCAAAAHKFHTCSLRSIFSAAHIAGKDDGIFFRRSSGETLRGFSLSGA